MKKLKLIKSSKFGKVECDIYSDEKEMFMTRTQIGKVLEYNNPSRAISDIHKKHKDRLDKFSRVTKISLPSGGLQEVYVYNARGIYEICRHSNQPKADAFYDWVYEILELLRKGENILIKTSEYQKLIAEAKLNNSKARLASTLIKLAENTQNPEYKQLCYSCASFVIAGKPLLPLPKASKKTSLKENNFLKTYIHDTYPDNNVEHLTTDELRRAFDNWAYDNGYKTKFNSVTFGVEMKKLGYIKKQKHNGRRYYSIYNNDIQMN